MNCFKLPVSLCNKLFLIVARYWWNDAKDKRYIAWVGKRELYKHKEDGGMGFIRFSLMNDALLVKQAWRILNCPELLISRVYKAKYFSNAELLLAEAGNRPSWAWRSIQGVLLVLNNWLHRRLPGSEAANTKDLTVKDLYAFMSEVQMQRIRNVTGENSDNQAARLFWHKFWRVKAQGKVKIFLWRLFYNAVPSAINLWKRGCAVDIKCARCGYSAESTTHVFLHCWWAQEFWRQLLGDAEKLRLCFSSMADWIWYCIKEFDGEVLSLIFYGIRWIWYARNLLWHNGAYTEISAAVSRVKAIVREISRADYRFVISREEAGSIWSPPEIGSVSINCDGAWESLSGKAGVGVICRDSEGQVVFVAAGRVEKCSSVTEAEGMAMLAGLKEEDRYGICRASFITDSAEVVLHLQGRRRNGGKDQNWIRDCQHLLEKHDDWRLVHVLREGNKPADLLATRAQELGWSWSSSEAIPRCISSLVKADLVLAGVV